MWTGNTNAPPIKEGSATDPNSKTKFSPNVYSAGSTTNDDDDSSSTTTSGVAGGTASAFSSRNLSTRHTRASISQTSSSFVDASANMEANLTPSRFDAPLQVKNPSQIQTVTEFARFEKMLRSWMWRRGVGMFLVGAFAYNAIFCPVMELKPVEDKCIGGLRRRRYLSEYVRLPNWFQQATGVRRKIWLFAYNQPLDDQDQDAEKIMWRNEVARSQRTKAAAEALKFNSGLPQINFGAAPLRPEDLPVNVKWKTEQMIRQERGGLVVGSGDNSKNNTTGSVAAEAQEIVMQAMNPTRRPLSHVAHQMWISALKWVPRTFTFNRPWGDNSGNSVQYNSILFEPVTFSAVKTAMLTVRPVVLKAPDGSKVRVRMLAQLYYRREEALKQEVGRLKYGEAEALIDYVAPQVCDSWLSSFSDLQELIDYAPPFRRTGTKAVLQNLPLADYLANAGEDPPEIVQSLIAETPKTLDRSVAVGAQTMSQEELLRRYLASNIMRRIDSKIAIDDVFWFLKVEDIPDVPEGELPGVYEKPNMETGNFVL
jgi:hypothetical protein